MAVSLKAIFSGDATPLVKAFKVVEVSANKASAVINTDFRKAIEVLGQTSAAAAAAGRSTKLYEQQVLSLTRQLRQQESAQLAANRAAEALAQKNAFLAMRRGASSNAIYGTTTGGISGGVAPFGPSAKVVVDAEKVLRSVSQGATFRQIKSIKLLTMTKNQQ